MLRLWSWILLLSLGMFAMPSVAKLSYDVAPAVGLWRTIDDVTGKPRSVIEITQDDSGLLSGFIRRVIAIPGEVTHDTCIKCRGELKNQPIKGMRMMWNMAANDGQWSGGDILDPKTGNIYRCRLRLSKDGQELEVRGYMGIALFGRSQTWHRA